MASSSARRFFSCVIVIFASAAILAGCARGIPEPGLDATISTASIPEPDNNNEIGLDADSLRDGETIASAVSSVQFTGKSIPWENTITGSSGDIISIKEQKMPTGVLCRHFAALRTSYDGIRNYSGTTCMNESGFWQLSAFKPN